MMKSHLKRLLILHWHINLSNYNILDSVPTGRDYTYSDLKRKIQEIFKGVE